jgi:hypothetical protein
MASSPAHIVEGDSRSVLQCVARNVLVCPCHERAAREFSELPVTTQDEVWNDLTGMEAKLRSQGLAPVEEPPQIVEVALHRLSLELESIVSKSASSSGGGGEGGRRNNASEQHQGLRMALNDFPSYSKDRAFQLKFLRAERFDIPAAAERMTLHFDIKLEIWGAERLGREIYLSDFDEDDLHSLRLGYFQVLPRLDHGGRKVLFYYKALTNCYRKRINILRTVWYLANSISNNESVQRLGVVNVVYNNGGFPKDGMDYEKSRRLAQIFKAIPIRFDSFFVCLDETPWLNVVDAFSFLVHKFIRVRMRIVQGRSKTMQYGGHSQYSDFFTNPCLFISIIHRVGSHMECLYKLMALGVPCESLPVTQETKLRKGAHLRFLEHTKVEEELQKRRIEQRIIEDQILNARSYDSTLQADFMDIDAVAGLMTATADNYKIPPSTSTKNIPVTPTSKQSSPDSMMRFVG